MSHTVLIIDDEETIRFSLRGILEDEEYEVLEAPSGEEALRMMTETPVSVILLDIWMDGIDGIETLRRIKGASEEAEELELLDENRDVPVIMMSGHGTIDTAVSSTKIGAYDFLEKPLSLDRVLILLERAIRQLDLIRENRALKARVDVPQVMVGGSDSMSALDQQISRLAPTNGTVLITGESGSGKEVAARQIHQLSARADKPFVAVNCAAIPENLIESELFGHEQGALPGSQARIGRFEQGNGGTLFLDEIGDMALNTQAKILRVLQEQRFERVGGSEQISVDVRVIASSNKDLKKEIAEGRFRKALYYRLNVIPLKIPPLRERLDDIPQLIQHFSNMQKGALPQHDFSASAMTLLQKYAWPGNVRELKNLVERLLIMSPGPTIQPSDLPEFVTQRQGASDSKSNSPWDSLLESKTIREAREGFERLYLQTHLDRHGGNISRTAETIGMERSALHRKMKTLGMAG
ncbi:MAG: sigma-54-dependent Fis family transcriptional regulator [Magnetococcales bacterium]|nr:sigma-54-dependent Fis family transcriptional regulator [Magnetococcales bacterium]